MDYQYKTWKIIMPEWKVLVHIMFPSNINVKCCIKILKIKTKFLKTSFSYNIIKFIITTSLKQFYSDIFNNVYNN